MQVTILGNNSALPAFGRHPSAQAIAVYGETLLIDCGEGTQSQMQRYGVKWRNIHNIFISHLHGDHYFGLPGLINSMGLLGRSLPLNIFCPPELEQLIWTMLKVADTHLNFALEFHHIPNETQVIVDTPIFSVTSFPVEHRIQCHGFLIEKKNKGRKILPNKCKEFNIPNTYFHLLKQGENYQHEDGTIVNNEWVTEAPPPNLKYAYCADTIFTHSYLDVIKNADTIYHESTYLEADIDKAIARYHSTAKQAAQLALDAHVKQLLLGHFSSKYKETQPFQDEATPIFPNTIVSVEGITYNV